MFLCRHGSTINLAPMALILDGDLEIGAHVRSNLNHLICLRHLIRSREVTYRIFLHRKEVVSFLRAQHVLSYRIL